MGECNGDNFRRSQIIYERKYLICIIFYKYCIMETNVEKCRKSEIVFEKKLNLYCASTDFILKYIQMYGVHDAFV